MRQIIQWLAVYTPGAMACRMKDNHWLPAIPTQQRNIEAADKRWLSRNDKELDDEQ